MSEPDKRTAALRGALTSFILVNVNTADLQHIGQLFQARKLRPHIGEVLRLSQVRAAHEMLEGGRHRPGKISTRPLSSKGVERALSGDRRRGANVRSASSLCRKQPVCFRTLGACHVIPWMGRKQL